VLNHVDPEGRNRGVGYWADQKNKGHGHAQIEEKLSDLSDSMLGWSLQAVPGSLADQGSAEEEIPAKIEVHLGQFTHEIVMCESFAPLQYRRTLNLRVT